MCNFKLHIASLITFLGSIFIYAQNRIPNAPNTLRKLPDNFKESYNSDEYDYVEHISFLEKLQAWLIDLLSRWFNIGNTNARNTFQTIKFILLAIILIIAIYYIVKLLVNKEARWLFGKKKEAQEDIDVEEIQNINEADFKSLIAQAETDLDYRSAIKYYYLLVLKKLDKAEIIKYDSQKTTHDYSLFLEGSKYHSTFTKIAYYYTYIWYGEFEINSEEYKTASSVFVELLKQFNNE